MDNQCVVLLKKVVAENVRLREAIKARDNEQRRILEELASKRIENSSNSTGQERASRKRTRKISIPQQCRQDIRKMYKALAQNEAFEGFKFDESFLAESNQNVTKTVIEAVVADHGGIDKCPWSTAEMKGAAATYLKTLHDASSRAKKGKLEAHKNLCRKQGRVRNKIQRRLSSLKTMPWSEEKKATIELAIGSPTYTSSDESDFSEDENGEQTLTGYLVKKLPWERSALTKVKKTLDDAYIRSLNSRARVNLVTRQVHPRPSTRCRPIGGLEWAVTSEEPTTAPRTRLPTSVSPSTSPPTMATPSSGTRPTTMATPSSGTRPTTMATPSSGTRPRTMATPSSGARPRTMATPSSGARPSTMATPSSGARPPTMVTPSSGTHPRTMATPSSGARPRTMASWQSHLSAPVLQQWQPHPPAPVLQQWQPHPPAQGLPLHR